MAYDEDLANRLRELLADEDALTEKKMFGGLAFLLHGNMAVSASGQGGLLARIDPADTEAALARPHAALMEMGKRSMAGWIRVAPEGVQDQARAGRLGQAQRDLRKTLPPSGRRASGEIARALGHQKPARGEVGADADDGPGHASDRHQQQGNDPVRADAHDGHQRDHGHDARDGAGGEAQHDQNTTCQIHGPQDAEACPNGRGEHRSPGRVNLQVAPGGAPAGGGQERHPRLSAFRNALRRPARGRTSVFPRQDRERTIFDAGCIQSLL